MRKNTSDVIKRMTALFLMLIMVVAILPQPVQAAGVSVTPGDVQLIAGGTVQLKEKVGKINEYGVLFQNEKAEQANGSQKKGYVYRVTKDNCRLYNYSLKFFKRMLYETMGGFFNEEVDDDFNYIFSAGGRLDFVKKFSSWQEYQAVIANDKEDDDGYIVNNLRPNGCDDDNNLRKYWLAANTKFCDLSQAMKVWVISNSAFFANRRGVYGMTYGDPAGASRNQSDTERMKYMSENKAVGVCEDYARYEVTIFSQLGIKSKYDHDGGHAWSVVYPTNADGKKQKLILDYGLYYGADSIYDRHLSPESDVY